MGTLLGAIVTFVLYGVLPVSLVVYLMGNTGAKKSDQGPRGSRTGAAASRRLTARQMPAANRPLTRSRRCEKNREGLATVHQSRAAVVAVELRDAQCLKPAPRQARQVGQPFARSVRAEQASRPPDPVPRKPPSPPAPPRMQPARCRAPAMPSFRRLALPSASRRLSHTASRMPRPFDPPVRASRHGPRRRRARLVRASNTGRQSATMMVQATPVRSRDAGVGLGAVGRLPRSTGPRRCRGPASGTPARA